MTLKPDDRATGTGIVGIDLGNLAEPATKLVEKVAEGISGLARPWQIRRVAKADAVARQIEAEAEIEITRLQQRAMRRFVSEEAAKQKNIEAITEKAFPHLLGDSEPAKIDNDWVANFFDKCRVVSDAEMQALWAKVLAGEANQPGSFSKRTVSIVATLSRQDAQMFRLYSSFCWRTEYGSRYSIDCAATAQFWPSRTVPFQVVEMHLRDLGLLGSIGEIGRNLSKVSENPFTYFDETYRVERAPGYRPPLLELDFSSHTYTTGAGLELMKIAGGEKLAGYAEAVMRELTTQFPDQPLTFQRISD